MVVSTTNTKVMEPTQMNKFMGDKRKENFSAKVCSSTITKRDFDRIRANHRRRRSLRCSLFDGFSSIRANIRIILLPCRPFSVYFAKYGAYPEK